MLVESTCENLWAILFMFLYDAVVIKLVLTEGQCFRMTNSFVNISKLSGKPDKITCTIFSVQP